MCKMTIFKLLWDYCISDTSFISFWYSEVIHCISSQCTHAMQYAVHTAAAWVLCPHEVMIPVRICQCVAMQTAARRGGAHSSPQLTSPFVFILKEALLGLRYSCMCEKSLNITIAIFIFILLFYIVKLLSFLSILYIFLHIIIISWKSNTKTAKPHQYMFYWPWPWPKPSQTPELRLWWDFLTEKMSHYSIDTAQRISFISGAPEK